MLGFLKYAVYRKYTHTHTHTHTRARTCTHSHTVQKLKQKISAAVTSINEHTLAGVMQNKDNYRYMLRAGSENGCI